MFMVQKYPATIYVSTHLATRHFVLSCGVNQSLLQFSFLLEKMNKILLSSLAVVLMAVGTRSLSCQGCPPSCPSTEELECRGGTVSDLCGCCDVCAKVVGEECGGPFNMLGTCDEGLHCDIPDPEDMNAHGECVELNEGSSGIPPPRPWRFF